MQVVGAASGDIDRVRDLVAHFAAHIHVARAREAGTKAGRIGRSDRLSVILVANQGIAIRISDDRLVFGLDQKGLDGHGSLPKIMIESPKRARIRCI